MNMEKLITIALDDYQLLQQKCEKASKTMPFPDFCKKMQGWNYDGGEFFDCNYGVLCVTINDDFTIDPIVEIWDNTPGSLDYFLYHIEEGRVI